MRVRYFFILFLFLTKNSSAQKFNAGLIAGLSTSQVDGDNLAGFHKVGLKAGGFVSHKIADQMQIQFEIEYIQKGSRMPLTNDGFFYLMRLNYIEVPLLLNYNLWKKYTVEAGGAVATLLSSTEEDQAGTIYNSPLFHKMDYLVCAGGNYFITEHLIFNARFSYSVTTFRMRNYDYNYFYSARGQYNKVLAFSLAWQF